MTLALNTNRPSGQAQSGKRKYEVSSHDPTPTS